MPNGWILEKTAHETSNHPVGKGCYFDTHRLKKDDGTTAIDLPDWEWAEKDGERIVWIAAGVLHAASLNSDGLKGDKVLFDFNPLTYQELRAPY